MDLPKKIVLAVAAIAFIAFAGLSYLGSAAANSNRVVVADIPLLHNAPLYLALEEKWFAQEGLSVEVVRFDSPRNLMDAVAMGRADVGGPGSATGIAAIVESLSPGSVRYYGFACDDGNGNDYHLLVRPDSNISSMKDLAGRKVARLPGLQWLAMTNAMLKANNVSLASVEQVEVPPQLQLQALSTGGVDAIIALQPVVTIGISKGVAKSAEAAIAPKYVTTPFCAGAGVVSARFLRERPDAAAKVLKVMKRAMVEANDEPRTRVLAKYLSMDEGVAGKLPFPPYDFVWHEDMTEGVKRGVQEFLDVFVREGILKKRVLVESMLAG
ncbi:MAG: ABC transporter substrate-binding protein [Candidatus Micrarchaeota archaeon]